MSLLLFAARRKRTTIASILSKFGSNAHAYIPGIGSISGLPAENFTSSTGDTGYSAVDGVVGLALDGMGTVGAEKVTNGTNLVNTTGWTASDLGGSTPATLSVSGGSLVVANTGTSYGAAVQAIPVTSGSTYVFTAVLSKGTAASVNIRIGAASFGYEHLDTSTAGTAVPVRVIFKAASASINVSLLNATTTNGTGIYAKISLKEITGIPISQATTAAKPLLRLTGGKYSWSFDGSNDSLALGSVPFQMADDHCVIAAVKPNAVSGYVYSQNNTAATTLAGSLAVNSSGNARALWGDDAAATAYITGTSVITGLQTVLTSVKVGNAKRLRVNGVQEGSTNNTVMGATTFNTASIGSYNTAGNINANIGPVIVIKGTVTDAELLALERLVGQIAGITI